MTVLQPYKVLSSTRDTYDQNNYQKFKIGSGLLYCSTQPFILGLIFLLYYYSEVLLNFYGSLLLVVTFLAQLAHIRLVS